MLSLSDIEAARVHVAANAIRTPILRSASLSRMLGCALYLKAENLQRTGSFKLRGASNKIAALSADERSRGVVAASAGNHAQGLALAAQVASISTTIVMPRGASFAKVEATRAYGAEVRLAGDTLAEAVQTCRGSVDLSQRTFVHPFDDEAIIAGQGTLGLEIVEDLPSAEIVILPVGGGGLIAGAALAIKETNPSARIVGVQAGAATAWKRSFESRSIVHAVPRPTVADGIAVGVPGAITSEIGWRYVDDMVEVSEGAISQAMVLLLERTKLLVEGAGAVGVAALLDGKLEAAGKTVVVVLSGGNVDAPILSRVVDHGLGRAGRFIALRVTVPDRPGQLARILDNVAAAGGNVLETRHRRSGLHLGVGEVDVELLLETRNRDHAAEIVAALNEAGYMSPAPSGDDGSVQGVHLVLADA